MFLCLLFVTCALFVAVPVGAQSATSELSQGHAAWGSEDWRAAREHFDRALHAADGNPNIEVDALHGRGVARLELHDWQGAKNDLTGALRLDPRDAGAFAARCMARKGLGDYAGLLSDAHEAARLNPAQFASFEEDAQSTVLWRRMLWVFAALAGVLLCIGGASLGRVLLRLMRAESAARRAAR